MERRFSGRGVFCHHIEARQTQIRFNSLRIDGDRAVEFVKGFLLVILRKQDAPHQDAAFDVIGIFLENFFRQPLGFGHGGGRLLGANQIVVAQLHAHVEIVLVQIENLLHLIERFLITLEAFESLSQSPVGVGELVVDLQRGAKFKRRFLKLFVLEQSLTARDVLRFGLFRGGTRAQQKGGGD